MRNKQFMKNLYNAYASCIVEELFEKGSAMLAGR
jgi:hypothetical protein